MTATDCMVPSHLSELCQMVSEFDGLVICGQLAILYV